MSSKKRQKQAAKEYHDWFLTIGFRVLREGPKIIDVEGRLALSFMECIPLPRFRNHLFTHHLKNRFIIHALIYYSANNYFDTFLILKNLHFSLTVS